MVACRRTSRSSLFRELRQHVTASPQHTETLDGSTGGLHRRATWPALVSPAARSVSVGEASATARRPSCGRAPGNRPSYQSRFRRQAAEHGPPSMWSPKPPEGVGQHTGQQALDLSSAFGSADRARGMDPRFVVAVTKRECLTPARYPTVPVRPAPHPGTRGS